MTPQRLNAPTPQRPPDVLIIGGGVIGCSAAFFLAREGARVTLLERQEIAAHASGAAAGMLAPICESSGEGPFFELGRRSLAMFPGLVAELRDRGVTDPQYEPSGVLKAALSPGEAAHLRSQAKKLAGYGLEWLDPGEARARERRLSPRAHGALWSPREGHVLSPAMTRAYAEAAAARGAVIRTGVEVQDLVRSGTRVTGVKTAGGLLEADHVVLAGGAWSGLCAPWLKEALPLEPVRGQIVSLDTPAPPLRSIVWSEDVYLVPKRDGSLVAGATEERVGFDCRSTAGGVASLLDGARRLLPALEGCGFRAAWAGLRPALPDHLPAIGPVPGVEGLTVAVGHFRNGVLLSPITGRLVADWVLRREFPTEFRPFLPERLVNLTAP